MVKWCRTLRDIPFAQLMKIYEEGNLEKAREEYADFPRDVGLRMAEEDFYLYLQPVFFRTPGSCYALWIEAETPVSALRLEPYRDGLLLAALETAPDSRRKGCGKKLVQAVLTQAGEKKIYSHVSKSNVPSLCLHEACGFVRVKETALYLDGSVNSKCCTFLYEKTCIL